MVRVPNRRIDVIDYLVDSKIALGSILVTDTASATNFCLC